MAEKLHMVFIGGCSRSGTTLVGQLLGGIEGFFDVGELHHLWKRSFAQDHPCQCARPFSQCPVWSQVVREAFSGPEAVDLAAVRRLRHAVHRAWRKGPFGPLLRGRAFRQNLRRYADVLHRFLQAAQDVTGCRVIVDSSKNPQHGRVLCAIDAAEVRIAHVIRDPRAVAFSFRRHKTFTGPGGREVPLSRCGPAFSAWLWRRQNAAARALEKVNPHYVRIRYEDLVARPREGLLQIAGPLGVTEADLGFLEGQVAQLPQGHSLSGNPVRERRGPIRIALDTEWQEKLPARDRRIVTALTWDLLVRYGYRRRV